MSNLSHDPLRALIARSLLLIEQQRERLVEEVGIHMRSEGGAEDADVSNAAARLLTEQLLHSGRRLVETGRIPGPGSAWRDQQALGISGRHQSRFSDALMLILADLLGPSVPLEIQLGWCELFWDMVAAMQPSEPEPKLRAVG